MATFTPAIGRHIGNADIGTKVPFHSSGARKAFLSALAPEAAREKTRRTISSRCAKRLKK